MREDLLVLAFARAALPDDVAACIPSTLEARIFLLGSLAGVTRERLVLVTCERFEVYLSGEQTAAALPAVAAALGSSPGLMTPFLRSSEGAQAAMHLLRVTAGLESRLLGEPQIQGQVRSAFLEGVAQGATGPVLSALARAALHAGRRVRSETGLGRRSPTIVTLALSRLAQELGGLRRRAVLVAGTGGLGVEVAKALRGAGAGRLFVLSRTRERANAVAARVDGGVGVSDDDLAAGLPLDAIVTCTNRRVPLDPILLQVVAAVRPFSIVDLGAPPNVDPRIAELAGIRLTRLGDLNAPGTAANPAASLPAIFAAERLLSDELRRFLDWRRARALYAASRVQGEAA